ncbi:diguanylate cyclase [Desulforhopalus vacuolatus]|uniref:sensor domain-containing diguanylate cyclase n=1 Tax=Desulforhopalus vacuolatus TaxID=40414 RepID=UPI001964BD9F|nr:diguanylate cyclase [Desulforhopalus vacuolatus]MBM9518236.1 diguanylate cyclase [Desulforhopalus vacuolatus]
MYHRLLQIFIATQDPQLERLLHEVQPEEKFSHQFLSSPNVDEANLNEYSVIILDFETVTPESMEHIQAVKDEHVAVIGCFTPESLPILAKSYHLFDQVWIKPFVGGKPQTSFARILKRFKEREESVLGEKCLDTLIDSLPDLIWFKDVRGSHLKVNDSFCRTVNKTKAQIKNRGHYYIWDLEPDEYGQGEYICLESEEIVLNKKETCLFEETVKCGDELRKFKTYKSPILDTDGKVIGTVGCAHDVTGLQNLLVELNILIEGLPFAVMVTDKDRNITSVNQKFIDIFVLDRTEFIGKKVEFLIDESKSFTRSKKWIIEKGKEGTLLLSKDKVLKIHQESLLDIFGILAGHVYLFIDITLEHQYKNKLLIDAHTDYLTKLMNRRSLQDCMRKTPCQLGTALLLADLDNFKAVNDQHGHDEGDKVLVAFSVLLQELFLAENIFRLGGDEFAIILPQVESVDMAKQCAEQLRTGFGVNVARMFPHTNISVSIGIAVVADDDSDFGELFKKADMALYDSKKSGKSACTLWTA